MITIIYEDELAGATPKNFGPHSLLLSCVADNRTDSDNWGLSARVKAVPKKGNGKLRKALTENLWAKAGPVIAVIDDDVVRSLYGLPSDSCKTITLGAIHAESTINPSIVLLEPNMEAVTDACLTALGVPLGKTKPRPAERDAICHRAVAAGPDVRSMIIRQVPSFARIVQAVERLL